MLVSKVNAIVSYNFVVFPIKVLKLKEITHRKKQKLFKKSRVFRRVKNSVFKFYISECVFISEFV